MAFRMRRAPRFTLLAAALGPVRDCVTQTLPIPPACGVYMGVTRAEIAELYAAHGYGLFRRCYSWLGDQAGAQDAVQEVFVRALRAGEGFRGEASVKTWLSRIADHHCLDLLRRERRSPVALGVEPPPWIGDDDGEAIADVRRLMDGLPRADRRLAILYYVDRLTQNEIAGELGVSRRTVNKRLRDLGERMRAALGGEERTG